MMSRSTKPGFIRELFRINQVELQRRPEARAGDCQARTTLRTGWMLGRCGRIVWTAAAGEHVQVTRSANLDVVVPQHRLQLVLPRSALVAASSLELGPKPQ